MMAVVLPSIDMDEEDAVTLDSQGTHETTSPIFVDDDEPLSFLCELVGACQLVVVEPPTSPLDDVLEIVGGGESCDEESLRPFCVVTYQGRRIHKTQTVSGTSPIWTPSNRSLFILRTTPRAFSQNALQISIFNKRQDALTMVVGRDSTCLGTALLDAPSVLSHCDEQRFEVDVLDQEGKEKRGTLALRFRLATPEDEKFVSIFNKDTLQSLPGTSPKTSLSSRNLFQVLFPSVVDQRSALRDPKAASGSSPSSNRPRSLAPLVTEKDETQVAGTNVMNALSTAFVSTSYRDRSTGLQKVRVKPGPDPSRVKETQHLTANEIKVESQRPSKKWVECGTGKLGKLSVEVISCHNLPNVDVGEAVGNVTDAFVCLVFEDAMAQTDVIDDELSPHWMPWTQRAFSFGIMHPASVLYLGVFDFDLGLAPHDPLGRVAVNISNFQRDTDYTLKYNLYSSSNVTARTANGSITIRLRVEYADEKEALLAAIRPRPKMHINVQKEKSFKVVRYTCFGEFDGEEKFDLTVTRSYVNEIFEYKSALSYCISDTIQSLIFWRGQVEIFSLLVPLHSALFFFMMSTLVERPYLAPPFFLICVAWIMLANLTMRRQHPSPWQSLPSFWHYLEILKDGHSKLDIQTIEARQGWTEAQAYDEAWQKRLEADQKVAAKKAALEQEIIKVGDDAIQTKIANAIPIDLLERLGRYQGMIGRYCRHLRFVRVILTWEESVISFWITAVFLFGGIVCLLLPWAFILTWTGRIVVWVLLGPHMKFVDLYLTSATHAQKDDKLLEKVVENFKKQSRVARTRREEALKLKDIKELQFGEYVTLVPAFNLARHFDRPLPDSTAKLCEEPSTKESLESTLCIPGQQLFGVMIPLPQDEANKRSDLVKKDQDLLQAVCAHIQRLSEERQDQIIPRDFDRAIEATNSHEFLKSKSEGTASTRLLPKINLSGWDNFLHVDGMKLCAMDTEALEDASSEKSGDQALVSSSSPRKNGPTLSKLLSEGNPLLTLGRDLGPGTEDAFSVNPMIIQHTLLSTSDVDEQDEGVEIVAWGKLDVMGDEQPNETLGGTDGATIGGLSPLFESSATVLVAFYRPCSC